MLKLSLRVLIVDDHALLAESVARFLQANSIEAAWCADPGRALQRMREEDWSVVLLDLSMPDGNGLDLLKRIKLVKPDLPVLILSMHPEQQFALRALRNGAAGYLTKGCSPEIVIEAIRKVARGGRYLTAVVADQLATHLDDGGSTEAPHLRLSDREMQVFMRLAQGSSVNGIAEELHISGKTVSTHKTRLMAKLGLDKDADLVRYAMHQGLIT